jgi:hypothetical protein
MARLKLAREPVRVLPTDAMTGTKGLKEVL